MAREGAGTSPSEVFLCCVWGGAMRGTGTQDYLWRRLLVDLVQATHKTQSTARPVSLILALDSVSDAPQGRHLHWAGRDLDAPPATHVSEALHESGLREITLRSQLITLDESHTVRGRPTSDCTSLAWHCSPRKSPLLLLEFANSIVRALGLQRGN
ncbi:hypothetical protein E2C01_006678 [Portunus trituberculatus]|uniref:Uncharacterized protein n=1 Tax=Portunus trituberculatus TaxID=210409 RepID=A0A5B7CWY0_PORTR|nr:hypothetical protein [Portunus trituberculatus]